MAYSALSLQSRSTVLLQRRRRTAAEDEVVLESWLSFIREKDLPSSERVQALVWDLLFYSS